MKRLISTILALTMVVSLFSNVAAVKGIAAEPPSDDLSYEAWSTWTSTKTSSAFFGEDYTQVVQENAKAYPKYQNDIDSQVKSAEFYLKQPLEYFDAMVFSPTITRAHMVFSNGWCPSCKKSVGLYDWKLNATGEPWKTRCPHCDDVFPKNDFKAFYESALDEQGYFRIENGDRSLLYNTEHPDPNDPLHMFGVDDGTGYKEGEGETWWFIGYYLIWGQWRRNIMPAVRTLSTAYSYTGNIEYARRLGILIDRLADFFPEYDFATQGILYNGDSISAGSVSYRIDNPGDCANIALAYDRVYDAIKTDTVFQEFVHQKAVERGLENEKTTFSQIAHNIEKNILRFIISDDKTIRDKIQSNYPTTENCILTIMNVLDKNRYQKSIDSLLDTVLKTATAYDGTNNEKGFSNYTIMNRANFYNVLASVAAYDETFMPRVVEKYPNIIKSFEIFRDLWAFGSFYPSNGDGGNFWDRSLGYTHSKTMNGSLGTPNNATVLWELYKITKDPTIIQFFAQQRAENPETLLPIDTKNLSAIGTQMQAIIDQYGTEVDRKTGNFSQYGLSMFHQGSGATERAFWFDSDTGSPHGHYDALSYGLYGYNTNLMVDLGYPPLNYPGSWSSDECWWYKATPMHNTVSFNRDFNRFWYPGPNPFDQSTLAVNSEQTLFADGKSFKAIGADGRAVVANIGQNTRQYDRVVAMNNIDEDSFYMFDVFRVNSDLVPYCMYQTGDATLTMDNDMTPLSGKGPFHEKWMIKNVESAANVTGNATATF